MKRKTFTAPCTDCQAPAEVKRRMDAPHARCERCWFRRRLFSLASYADERAARAIKQAREATASEDRARHYAEFVKARAEAAALVMESVKVALDDRERRVCLRAAESRIRQVAYHAPVLADRVADARSDVLPPGFKVIEGAAEVLPIPDTRPAIKLGVVRD